MKFATSASIRRRCFWVILTFAYLTAMSHPKDNVMLIDGTETWQFIPPKGNNPACVKNHISHIYEATRYGEQIQPAIFYNDVMKLDKASGKGKARYESAPSRNVFHDDNRVCYFDMKLDGPGKKSKVQFERTVTDPAMFSFLHLSNQYPVKHKETRIIIPPDYPGITVEEHNFTPDGSSGISRRMEELPDGSRVYIYELNNLEGTINAADEFRTPNPFLYRPILLIKGWFPTLDDLCRWHVDISRVDTDIPGIDTFLKENVYGSEGNSLSPRQKLERIYSWVQKNIRYVAYEEGESGHRPDTPAEVLRKRYGDCKGMALLLATLLQHEGIDAKAAVIGTNNIGFNIAETPSLAATDHSICVAVENGDTLYLDATNEYIAATHIPEAIQGKDAILLPKSNDGNYTMIRVPRLTPAATATDSVNYNYTLSPDLKSLHGTATRTLSGDFKEAYLSIYSAKGEKYIDENMAIDLVPLRRSSISVESLTKQVSPSSGIAVIEAPIENSEAVTTAEQAIYIELNAQNGVSLDRIDNHDRQSPYRLPGRGRIVRESVLTLPPGVKLTHLPESFSTTTPHAVFSCDFSAPAANTVIMRKSVEITDPMIAIQDIDGWNKSLAQWENACKNQIEFSITNH